MTKKLSSHASLPLPTVRMRLSASPICHTYDEIFRHYFEVSGAFLKVRNKALKTDCYNESITRPIVGDGSVKMIEYQQSTIDEAKRRNPSLDIIRGDIRYLPFKDGEFNLILDLSTLDHIRPSEVESTLAGYNRVLEKNGVLVLITWVTESVQPDLEWNPDNQYYFAYETVSTPLRKFFNVMEEKLLFTRIDQKIGPVHLYEFLCLK